MASFVSSVPGSSTTSTPSKPTSTSSTTTCPTSVSVTFNGRVETIYGTNVKLVGSVAALGNWNTANGVALSSAGYTTSNPIWSGTMSLAAGSVVLYKYVKIDSSGSVTWWVYLGFSFCLYVGLENLLLFVEFANDWDCCREADPNHTLTVPACAAATTVSSSWQ